MSDQSELIFGKNPVLAFLESGSESLGEDNLTSQKTDVQILEIIKGKRSSSEKSKPLPDVSYLRRLSKISINKILLGNNYRSDARIQKIKELARAQKVPIVICDRRKLDQLTGPNQSHQGVVALISAAQMWQLDTFLQKLEVDIAEYSLNNKSLSGYMVALLDGIEDPHNLGAIIRVAEAAGVKAIFIPQHRSVGLTGTVAKISAGALATMPVIRVSNLIHSIETLKKYGFWVVGMDCAAQQLYTDTKYDFPLVVVIGSEGKGISRLIAEHCDFLVKIPMLGKVESLNASVSSGILFYEVVRQNQNQN